jgi:adenylate kinase
MGTSKLGAKLIAISGTPGTGKSHVAQLAAERLSGKVISLSEFVKANELYDSWDDKLQTYIVDEDRARESLIQELQRIDEEEHPPVIIIDGLFADIIADLADVAVVLRLNPEQLRARLVERGYQDQKVLENIQAEVLGTCSFHMKEAVGSSFFDINTTGHDADEIATTVIGIVDGSIDGSRYAPGLVDWIADPTVDVMGILESNRNGE